MDNHEESPFDHEAEPLPLEKVEPEACPNCGTDLPGDTDLVCMECGYNLKDNRVEKTRVGQTEVDEEGEDVREGFASRSWTRTLLVISAVIAGVMVVCYMIGLMQLFDTQDGLFRNSEGAFKLDAPTVMNRLISSAKSLVLSGMIGGCVSGGAAMYAMLTDRRVGDVGGLIARGLATAMLIGLLRLIPIPFAFVYDLVYILGGAMLAGLVIMILFRTTIRDAGVILGISAISLIILVLGSRVIMWVT
ncbi:MAG: hypothetical protein CMJ32_05980 [Phycisphaerae bacterium]|nr:hypothetical protein [Phycisphaerae bacterium]